MGELTEFADATVTLRVDAHVGWITLNRPDRHNALTPAMFDAIGHAADAASGDPEVRAIVIRGAGERAFASGADINDLTGSSADLPRGLVQLQSCAVPTIAMIRGYCFGGGLMTALCTDLRVASTDAVFAIPAGRLGVGYPLAASKRLVDIVGPAVGAEILLTGERFTSEFAHRVGLVNRVVRTDDLSDAVANLTDTIVANAPLTATASKRSIAAALDDAYDGEAHQAIKTCWNSADYAEGRQAFADRRPPEFRGV